MSMNKNYYVIVGFDLTKYKTDKFDDWKWEDENERYFCNQSKGHIQLSDDPMTNNHLYLGYVLADGDEYEFNAAKFPICDFEAELPDVYGKIIEVIGYLEDVGVIDYGGVKYPYIPYELIVFEECS